MVKRYISIALALAVMIAFSACTGSDKAAEVKVKPVKVIEVKEEVSPVKLDYSGLVASDELRKLSFKSGGRIGEIHVEKGQQIKAGDILVELEDQDLHFSLTAAEAMMGAAQSAYDKAVKGASSEEVRNAELNVKKAQDAYAFISTSYGRIENLYKTGAVSKNDMEKAKLEVDIREAELDQAKQLLSHVKTGARIEDKKALAKQLEQAKADYDYKASLVQDAVMTSDADGYVVEVLYKEGELVPPGYPVVVVRGNGTAVNVGLAEKDYDKVKPGMRANISSGTGSAEGSVKSIAQVPDAQSGTYEAEIDVSGGALNIGAVVDVEIITGTGKGIWIPLTSMLSDGMDYVYLAKGSIAEKREISIEEISGSNARVTGLLPGEQLVVEGMKRLRAGDGISAVK
ncbi:MAG TPA: biotin/lipoyl-binding protein [Negativicutes bacterium]|nr:biotin/lipoyl-binding protein [Negativicutes bacterium]